MKNKVKLNEVKTSKVGAIQAKANTHASLRQIFVKISEGLLKKLQTKLNFIERAFQRRITCAIWTRNERDMQF